LRTVLVERENWLCMRDDGQLPIIEAQISKSDWSSERMRKWSRDAKMRKEREPNDARRKTSGKQGLDKSEGRLKGKRAVRVWFAANAHETDERNTRIGLSKRMEAIAAGRAERVTRFQVDRSFQV
jgi:hypothetical protein